MTGYSVRLVTPALMSIGDNSETPQMARSFHISDKNN